MCPAQRSPTRRDVSHVRDMRWAPSTHPRFDPCRTAGGRRMSGATQRGHPTLNTDLPTRVLMATRVGPAAHPLFLLMRPPIADCPRLYTAHPAAALFLKYYRPTPSVSPKFYCDHNAVRQSRIKTMVRGYFGNCGSGYDVAPTTDQLTSSRRLGWKRNDDNTLRRLYGLKAHKR